MLRAQLREAASGSGTSEGAGCCGWPRREPGGGAGYWLASPFRRALPAVTAGVSVSGWATLLPGGRLRARRQTVGPACLARCVVRTDRRQRKGHRFWAGFGQGVVRGWDAARV